jgi:hypothetical protein
MAVTKRRLEGPRGASPLGTVRGHSMWGTIGKRFTRKHNRVVFVSPWQMQRTTKLRRLKWIDTRLEPN